MKKLVCVIILLVSGNLFAQQSEQTLFSKIHLSILGGTTFNSIPTIGGAISLEGMTPITNKLKLKLSVGYAGLFEDVDYTARGYKSFIIENVEGYSANSYKISEIQYSIIPINVGLEFRFLENEISPFAIIDVGINNYSGEEQIESGGSETYNSLDEVPEIFKTYKSKEIDGTAYNIGLGLGVNYQLSHKLGISIRYMFRYNDNLVNSNQILMGLTF